MSEIDLKSATVLLEEGKTSEAKIMLEELIARAPSHVAAHVLLARINESEEEFENALQNWQNAFGLLPTSSVVEKGLRRAVLRSISDPSENVSAQESEGETEADESLNLELLIQELEKARIVPDPDVQELSDDELEDEIEDLVSETLARIYAAQKYFEEARQVYEKLAHQNPERAHEFETKAMEMEKLAREKD